MEVALASAAKYLKGGMIFAALCLLVVSISLSCRSTSQGGSNVTEDLGIPPIDLSAPAVTETATFAMG